MPWKKHINNEAAPPFQIIATAVQGNVWNTCYLQAGHDALMLGLSLRITARFATR